VCILLQSFENFPVNTYYEPLLWFMIQFIVGHTARSCISKAPKVSGVQAILKALIFMNQKLKEF